MFILICLTMVLAGCSNKKNPTIYHNSNDQEFTEFFLLAGQKAQNYKAK